MPENTAMLAVANPSQVSKLRHDIRTLLNHILGYSDLLRDESEGRGASDVLAVLSSINTESRAVVERLNALALMHPSEDAIERVAAIQAELREFAVRSAERAEVTRERLEAFGSEEVISDLDRLVFACQALPALANQLKADALVPGEVHSLHRSPGDLQSTGASPTTRQVTNEIASPLARDRGRGPSSHSAPAKTPTAGPARPPNPPNPGRGGTVLVVDDDDGNRDILSRLLERYGLEVYQAGGGLSGLEQIQSRSFDVVLLDLMMPDLDGFSVLREIKSNPDTRCIPVVMLSASDEAQGVIACLEAGAEDYLSKPYNPTLLGSRIRILLDRKFLQDEQRRRNEELETALAEVESQKKISERLLANILPEKVAHELQSKGYADPMYFEDVTIILTDFAGFTNATAMLSAEELVDVLNTYFTAFDRIVDRYGLEKLKTIGDSYMCVSGLPERTGSHPVDAVLAALEMLEVVRQLEGNPVEWKMRVGIHTGPVIAGVVGIRKFAFDIWGESVNMASRMESSGEPNRVNISERTYSRVKDFFACESRGTIRTKDGRDVEMYFAAGLTPKLCADTSAVPPPLFCRRYQVYFQKPPRAFPDHLVSTPPQ